MARTKFPRFVFEMPLIKTGRPPIFKDPEKMQEAVDRYFESCWEMKKIGIDEETGEPIYEKVMIKPYLVSGLAFALGMSTESLRKYGSNHLQKGPYEQEIFFAIVNAAKQRVEQFAEEKLFSNHYNGGRFVLACNYRWKETQVNEVTGGEGKDLIPQQQQSDARATETLAALLKMVNGG